jgi:hypothetical protein
MTEYEGPPVLDAVRFVHFSESLRAALQRMTAAPLTTGRRSRWRHRLVAITDHAQHDLEGAQAQLDRYNQDWDKELG